MFGCHRRRYPGVQGVPPARTLASCPVSTFIGTMRISIWFGLIWRLKRRGCWIFVVLFTAVAGAKKRYRVFLFPFINFSHIQTRIWRELWLFNIWEGTRVRSERRLLVIFSWIRFRKVEVLDSLHGTKMAADELALQSIDSHEHQLGHRDDSSEVICQKLQCLSRCFKRCVRRTWLRWCGAT